MDRPGNAETLPQPASEHPDVMSLLSSDDWQKRLKEARQARERLLAGRAAQPAAALVSALRAVPRTMPESGQGAEEAFPDLPEPAPPPPGARPDPDAAPLEPTRAGALLFEGPSGENHRPANATALPQVRPSAPRPGPESRAEALARPWRSAPTRLRTVLGFAAGVAAGIGLSAAFWAAGSLGPLALRQTGLENVQADPPAPVPVAITPTRPRAAAPLPTALPAPLPDAPGWPGPAALPRLPEASLPLPPAIPATDQPPARNDAPAPPSAAPSLASPPPAPTEDQVAALPQARPGPAPAPALSAPPAPPQQDQPPPAADEAPSPQAPAVSAPPAPRSAAAPAAPQRLAVIAPDSLPDASLSRTIAWLRATGFPPAATDRVSYTISADHVRFYHPQDRAAAQALARQMGGEARDFSASGIAAPPGLIELWLQGNAPSARADAPPPRAKAAKGRPQQAQDRQEDAAIRQLRDRIIRQLQQGGRW